MTKQQTNRTNNLLKKIQSARAWFASIFVYLNVGASRAMDWLYVIYIEIQIQWVLPSLEPNLCCHLGIFFLFLSIQSLVIQKE